MRTAANEDVLDRAFEFDAVDFMMLGEKHDINEVFNARRWAMAWIRARVGVKFLGEVIFDRYDLNASARQSGEAEQIWYLDDVWRSQWRLPDAHIKDKRWGEARRSKPKVQLPAIDFNAFDEWFIALWFLVDAHREMVVESNPRRGAHSVPCFRETGHGEIKIHCPAGVVTETVLERYATFYHEVFVAGRAEPC